MSWATESKSFDFSEYTYEKVVNHPSVSLVDKDDTLEVYCYDDCKDTEAFERKVRGMIFDVTEESKPLVSVTFGYTPYFNVEDAKLKELLTPQVLRDCEIFESHEGSILKLFYRKDKWYLSTHKKLDAFTSKRSSDVSLGDTFLKCLQNEGKTFDELKATLQQDVEYVFLLENTRANRKVCYPNGKDGNPMLYHVGSICNLEFIPCNIGFPTPKKVKVTTLSELLEYINKLDYNKVEGVIITLPNQDRIKIYNKAYHDLFDLRSNEHSVAFRYLQVRGTENKDRYRALYPDHMELFDDYESRLSMVILKLHRLYLSRHVGHNFVYTTPAMHNLCKKLHKWFIEQKASGTGYIVTLDVVRAMIDKECAQSLLALMNSLNS